MMVSEWLMMVVDLFSESPKVRSSSHSPAVRKLCLAGQAGPVDFRLQKGCGTGGVHGEMLLM